MSGMKAEVEERERVHSAVINGRGREGQARAIERNRGRETVAESG